MPLFECTQCHVVENTACTSESWRQHAEGQPMRCSQCADGKWHGLFPRKLVSDTKYVTDARGFLEPPGGWPKVGDVRPSEFDGGSEHG